ncbi:DUF2793 domain-containing protein [Amaricoccus solimangrovi]|uniref:DUF2793 domain-containing protein n=1 Tax=Amaricoccus solimangrovi TaxID=2589815 RepID=A0A501WQU7_9RHOB|nr:DUF2793 domain-containing protein [Amaricoccus solimangrovi]TPE50715.1 DUF2793 domain-containing protein [Amaricoccus solimangrovi]
MAKTTNLALPLISPSQAQKHVTVNEALARLDAVTQMRVLADDLRTPPASAEEGAGYVIPDSASASWAERHGQIAVWSNGGWVYLSPVAGWRAWHISRAAWLVYDGAEWVSDAISVSRGGARTTSEILEFDQRLGAGASLETEARIPANALVTGVTGRVLETLEGTMTGWRLGVSAAGDRYGTGLGLAAGSYLLGLSGSPTSYYAETPLVIGAEGGIFAAGKIRLAIHLTRLAAPRME